MQNIDSFTHSENVLCSARLNGRERQTEVADNPLLGARPLVIQSLAFDLMVVTSGTLPNPATLTLTRTLTHASPPLLRLQTATSLVRIPAHRRPPHQWTRRWGLQGIPDIHGPTIPCGEETVQSILGFLLVSIVKNICAPGRE